MARSQTTNAQAAEATIKALGLTDKEHQALVVACRTMAMAVDREPQNASLWREYRQLLVELGRVASGVSDDDQASFLVSIQTPGLRSQVRHTPEP